MQDFVSGLPKTDALKRGLTSALQREDVGGRSLTLLGREPTPYATTFPCEIVTCRIGRGKPRRLFCKYTAGVDYTGHGHRGGVGHEIATYRHILTHTNKFRPRFYGSYTDSETGQYWLFLEYLDGSLRVGKLNDPAAMEKTARWIAQFHVTSQRLLSNERLPFLKRYDKEYYLGWISRTVDFAGPNYRKSSWLHHLDARAEDFLYPLLGSVPAIIHGEYYQHNILFHQGRVCPIDWESAAVGEGLIDLACLTDGWESKIADVCTATYLRTRWPEEVPAEFERVLNAARLYMTVRWLGDDAGFTRSASARRYWMQLRNLVTELERI
jgi:aminoglycoside phosphotransferase (APT) family kinase protein